MIDATQPLLLGSRSPRRRELLELMGVPVRVASAIVDETPRAGEDPDRYLGRVTLAKLAAVGSASEAHACPAALVADTIVIQRGTILGKPRDVDEAARMIRALSGNTHEVWTRFAVAELAGFARVAHAETVRTSVTVRELAPDEIAGYAASGEGLDKAGAYAIQGLGGSMVQRIDGSYHNVVGLPVCEVIVALRRLGLIDRFPAARPER